MSNRKFDGTIIILHNTGVIDLIKFKQEDVKNNFKDYLTRLGYNVDNIVFQVCKEAVISRYWDAGSGYLGFNKNHKIYY